MRLFEDGYWYSMCATAFAEVNHNNYYSLRIKGLGVISKELFSDEDLHDAQRFFQYYTPVTHLKEIIKYVRSNAHVRQSN